MTSGLALVPWVVAFGVPGRLFGRLSPRSQRHMPWLGCAILGLAYALLAATMLTGTRPAGLRLVLLALGGLGLGTLYLSRVTGPGVTASSHAFGIVCAASALIAWLATLAAHRATRTQPSTVGTPEHAQLRC